MSLIFESRGKDGQAWGKITVVIAEQNTHEPRRNIKGLGGETKRKPNEKSKRKQSGNKTSTKQTRADYTAVSVKNLKRQCGKFSN
jgi:hypothetical protein